MSSCEVGMYSREYAKGTLIGTKPFSLSWIDSPVTLLVLIEFEPKLVLTCRSTWGASTSSCCSKVLEIKTSVDWSSKTACVVNFLAGLDWWDACTRTILAHHLLVSSSPQTYVQAVDICFNSGVLDYPCCQAFSQYVALSNVYCGKCRRLEVFDRNCRHYACWELYA